MQEFVILITIGLGLVKQRLESKDVITVIDLGIIDHYFVDYANFVRYKEFQTSLVGRIAKKRTSFEIVG